ncbi:phospho-sugar mutase [Geodermatophilus obscurus]|uniref:Glucose-1,6-bisphosphate synthase n=1 Tax=Geodermatophilus obscurus (strain ATCC 25078 / DSM 43160 / JCM 3152 / CCUG 61914 / KCC A-0152 / KCTC 9177 / NBRC 13315 / NRRL B-3577 / G-20) TaxID=526225 RepID=D2SG68_GEOOG|nr:phospho-sugar mutase [Geodermatophilus obscurus]ADB76936.1 Glucose-1,6-bisphosphate synthase [Geodermatophilus obscurus DSM 43160]
MTLLETARAWADADPHDGDRAEIEALIEAEDRAELERRFAGPLTFGTAGLRGPLRAGPAGMNAAVVTRAAAGLGRWLADAGHAGGGVVIGFDARRRSDEFARVSAEVLAGAGFAVQVLPRPLPTPVLSFAVRHLGCAAGVMVTASHNPPDDNGYKVYLGDGAQLVPPADREIEAAIAAVGPAREVPGSDDWLTLGDDVEADYVAAVVRALDPGRVPDRDHLVVAYTAMHGVGAGTTRSVFAAAGLAAPVSVPEQDEPDPAFPTVAFPNPEEPGAVDLLTALAERVRADVAIAEDPDADRCSVVCGGRQLTGDEVGGLLADWLLRRGVRGTFAASLVSGSLLHALTAAHGVRFAETPTGFKWIVRAGTDDEPLVFGYEEALGYAVAPQVVKDKDGISAALAVALLAAELRSSGRTLTDRLDELALEHGLFVTGQLSVRVEDLSRIGAMMARLRSSPPAQLLGRPVVASDLLDETPAVDAVRLLGDGVRVIVRPSGTEPKLKAYLETVVPVHEDAGIIAARGRGADELDALRSEMAVALGL